MIWILLATSLQSAGEEKIGKEKAPAALRKCLGETVKKKGWHFAQTVKLTGPENQENKFDGVAKKDFAAAKGSAEIYAKGASYLVHSNGKFVPPNQLSGTEAIRVGSFRNPALFLSDAARLAVLASWGTDAEVDGRACKVAEFAADEPLLKDQIKEFTDNFKSQLKQVGNVMGYVDLKRSKSLYKIYLGKSDLLVHKVEWTLKPVIKENAFPPSAPVPQGLDKLEARTEVVLSKHDQELDVEIPKEIQQRFGVK